MNPDEPNLNIGGALQAGQQSYQPTNFRLNSSNMFGVPNTNSPFYQGIGGNYSSSPIGMPTRFNQNFAPRFGAPSSLGSSNMPVASQTVAYSLNGKNYNSGGDLITAGANPAGGMGGGGGGGIDYTLHPGESIAAYQARIASEQAGQGSPNNVNNSGGSQGLGMGGGQAPVGYQYGPDGQLQAINSAPTPDVSSNVSTSQPVTSGTSATSNEDVNSSMQQNITAYLNDMGNNQNSQDAHNQYIQALQNYQNFNTNLTAGELNQYGVGRPLALDTGRAAQLGFNNQVQQQTLQNQVNTSQSNEQFALGQQQLQASVGQNALSDLLQVGSQGLTQQQINLSALSYSKMTADQQAQFDVQYFQTFGTMPPPSITNGVQGSASQTGSTGNSMATPTAFSNTGSTPSMSSGNFMGYDISSYATDPNYSEKLTPLYQQAQEGIGQNISPQSIQSYISQVSPKSPITGQMVYQAAITGGGTGAPVDPYMLVAQMQLESQMGTSTRSTATKNPGNVGNTDSGANQYMPSWQAGLNSEAAWLAKHPAQQQTQSSQQTLQSLQQVLPPQLSAPGVLNALSDGTPYFQSSKISSSMQTMANLAATKYNIPILSDDQVGKIQNIDTLTQKINQMVPLISQTLGSGIGGKIGNTASTWWNNVFGTNQGINQLNSYNTAAISAIENIVGGSGSGVRVTGAEIGLAQSLVPNSTDTLEQAQTKLSSLQSQINEWRNEYFSGAPIPSTFGQIQMQIQGQGSQPQQISYQGQTYNVDGQGNMTLAQ